MRVSASRWLRRNDRSSASKASISAQPNPVPAVEGSQTIISWNSDDARGAEVRVAIDGGEEKLVSRAASGKVEIPWIASWAEYEFRLYGLSQPEALLDSVKVRRDTSPLRDLVRQFATELDHGQLDDRKVAEFVAMALPPCLASSQFGELFRLWERHALHVTPVHFYQPIPDTRSLPSRLWEEASELVGIDMNDETQLDLLRNQFPRFRAEYEQFPNRPIAEPARFYLDNAFFGGTDALVAYCMIRHFQPQLIIEVGSGFSSLLVREANANGNQSKIVCIEPFPQDFLRQGFPGLDRLIEKNVQDVDLSLFSQLQAGDVLFIDSSHTVKIGGDVNYLFLEVLPRLNKGVIVHVHDVLLPFEYRRDWVMDGLRFWAEQYLLQAFLCFNSAFEVLLANAYLGWRYLEDLKSTFPTSPWWADARPNMPRGGGSFWMRRRFSRAD